jgi:hypothetical protein
MIAILYRFDFSARFVMLRSIGVTSSSCCGILEYPPVLAARIGILGAI